MDNCLRRYKLKSPESFTLQLNFKLINMNKLVVIPALLLLFSTSVISQNKSAKLIIQEVEKVAGTWNKLWEQKDVQFNYLYDYPGQNKSDISTERYVFDTEQSWAKYTRHDINVMPGVPGNVIQYYDGKNSYISLNGELLDNTEAIGGAKFLRKANYFWFVMMFKLNNPGTIYKHLGTETLEGKIYDKVEITYDSEVTGKEQNDIYKLYVNQKTKLVDQFYFSLPAMGVMEPLILMKLEYDKINGLYLPVKRNIYMPSENGYSTEPNLVQTTTNISFNNGFILKDFQLK